MDQVTLVFADKEGATSYIQLPWIKGQQFRQYLRHPALRKYHLVVQRLRARAQTQDRRNVRFNSVLAPGDMVRFTALR